VYTWLVLSNMIQYYHYAVTICILTPFCQSPAYSIGCVPFNSSLSTSSHWLIELDFCVVSGYYLLSRRSAFLLASGHISFEQGQSVLRVALCYWVRFYIYTTSDAKALIESSLSSLSQSKMCVTFSLLA
jgi:hypothetical protein